MYPSMLVSWISKELVASLLAALYDRSMMSPTSWITFICGP